MKYEKLKEILESRRTYRRFDQSKIVPQEVIDDMKNSLRLYSSATNGQPLKFVFVTGKEKVEEIFQGIKWAARLPKEIGTPVESEKPPMYVVVYYDKAGANKWVDIDVGLAISNLTLTAWNHGVGSCIFGSHEAAEMAKICDLDEGVMVPSVIAFGYPTHKSTIVDVKDGELGYYVDDKRDYYVPKKSVKDMVKDL